MVVEEPGLLGFGVEADDDGDGAGRAIRVREHGARDEHGGQAGGGVGAGELDWVDVVPGVEGIAGVGG